MHPTFILPSTEQKKYGISIIFTAGCTKRTEKRDAYRNNSVQVKFKHTQSIIAILFLIHQQEKNVHNPYKNLPLAFPCIISARAQ